MTADQHGPLGVARLVRPERLARSRQSHDEVATIAYWHVEFWQPPGIITAELGPATGPGHTVHHLAVHAPPDAPRFYSVAAITLADLPGVAPARKALPHFTHELITWTLDGDRHTGYDNPLPWHRLDPHNLAVQWEDTDDDAARETVRAVVVGLLHGQLSPEVQAYVPSLGKMQTLLQLHQAWEDTVRATAEHARTGGTHDLGHG